MRNFCILFSPRKRYQKWGVGNCLPRLLIATHPCSTELPQMLTKWWVLLNNRYKMVVTTLGPGTYGEASFVGVQRLLGGPRSVWMSKLHKMDRILSKIVLILKEILILGVVVWIFLVKYAPGQPKIFVWSIRYSFPTNIESTLIFNWGMVVWKMDDKADIYNVGPTVFLPYTTKNLR